MFTTYLRNFCRLLCDDWCKTYATRSVVERCWWWF